MLVNDSSMNNIPSLHPKEYLVGGFNQPRNPSEKYEFVSWEG